MLPVLLGLGALIGGVLIVHYWDQIVDWLHDFIPKLKRAWESVRTHLPHAAAMFGDMVVKGFETVARIMHKLYYKENGKWYEQTTTRELPEEEVPDFIREKIEYGEANITPEIESELGLTV